MEKWKCARGEPFTFFFSPTPTAKTNRNRFAMAWRVRVWRRVCRRHCLVPMLKYAWSTRTHGSNVTSEFDIWKNAVVFFCPARKIDVVMSDCRRSVHHPRTSVYSSIFNIKDPHYRSGIRERTSQVKELTRATSPATTINIECIRNERSFGWFTKFHKANTLSKWEWWKKKWWKIPENVSKCEKIGKMCEKIEKTRDISQYSPILLNLFTHFLDFLTFSLSNLITFAQVFQFLISSVSPRSCSSTRERLWADHNNNTNKKHSFSSGQFALLRRGRLCRWPGRACHSIFME